MASNSRSVRRYDIDFSSVILYLLDYCVLSLIFTFAAGSDVLFYSWFPMTVSALSAGVSCLCVEGFVGEQIRKRMQRGKTEDAFVLFRSAGTLSFLWAVFVILFLGFSAGILGESVLGFSLIPPLLQMFAPAAAMAGFTASMRGFLRGVGCRRLARISLWMETAIFLVLGIALGFFCASYGARAGALLRNDDISAVYCGCGIAAGLDFSVLISVLFLAICCGMCSRQIRRQVNERDAYLADAQRSERRGDLMLYLLQKTAPGAACALMAGLGMTLAYRFWLTGRETTRTSILTSVWGGFAGAGLPIVLLCILLSALPLTSLTVRIVRDAQKAGRKVMRMRLGVLLRLSSYIGIPCSAFLFGAAKEIVAVLPNLTFKAQEAAILTVKAGSFSVFLGLTALLMGYFFWNTMHRRELLIATASGFFVQVVLIVVLDLMGVGITLGAWTMDAFFLVLLLVLYVLGKQDLIRGMKESWFVDDAVTAVCAGLAVLPIELLNDYLIQVMPAAAALILAAAVFAVLYVLLSILLRAADLHNLIRIPGGSLVISLAVLMGVADREEERGA